MPLRLDVKRTLTARSDRVKCVDLHQSEPWLLVALYNGHVHVWHLDSSQLIKTLEVCDVPVRAARFVARKNWLVTGSDDMQLRAYNYNTLERVHTLEAHSDYIRSIAVHPTQPFILTSSDDMTIKLWNWDKAWACQQVFEGHTHYVMQVVINPKDNNTFASASLDRTVKVWQLGSTSANFTLDGHEKGVNCVDYYHGGDKPYLISGADDRLVKIWDYQNKNCVQTLDGHAQNVSAVCFHADLPIIMTGSEDGTVRVWHVNTYRLEATLNYGLERVWSLTAAGRASNCVAIGYDEGCAVVKVGRDEPAVSMDAGGKIVWARHCELQQANLRAAADTATSSSSSSSVSGGGAGVADGERIVLAAKDMGSCDVYPQTIAHNPNGRFVVVCGDGEYIIYTAMALRNKAFGAAQEFVWALDSSEYAVRENTSQIKLFKNFKEKKTFKPDYGCDGIFGGQLLGVRSSAALTLYDWESLELIRRIEIVARHMFWSESGQLVCIATDESYFMLRYNAEAVATALQTQTGVSEDGVDDAFEVLGEVQESVKTGVWVGDCFIYTNAVNRLNYYVGGEIVTIAHLDRAMYLLGYLASSSAVYLVDKELNVCCYKVLLSVLEYQTAVMRADFATADAVLPAVPREQRARVAHFLEKQGFKQQALAVSTDAEHRFELALQLGELKIAHQLAVEQQSELKWKQLAELATRKGRLQLAQECLRQAGDFGGLLLLATSAGNKRMVCELAESAHAAGLNNVAFLAHFVTNNKHECLQTLMQTNRFPEAAFFARSYLPSQVSRVVEAWREWVTDSASGGGEKTAASLASPDRYDNLFAEMTAHTLAAEQFIEQCDQQPTPARLYSHTTSNWDRDVMAEMQRAQQAGQFCYRPHCPAAADNNNINNDNNSQPDDNHHPRGYDQQHTSFSSDGGGFINAVQPSSSPPAVAAAVGGATSVSTTSQCADTTASHRATAVNSQAIHIQQGQTAAELDLVMDEMNLDDVDVGDVGDVDLDDEDLLTD